MVGTPVWPSGATEAAEAVFIVTAEAASAAVDAQAFATSRMAAETPGWANHSSDHFHIRSPAGRALQKVSGIGVA